MDIDIVADMQESLQPIASSSRQTLDRMDTDSSRSRYNSSIDLNTMEDYEEHTTNPQKRKTPCFRVLYVPDPTRSLSEKQARNDLAFVKTTISDEELNAIRQLTGSVHFLSKNASITTPNSILVQEWVSRYSLQYIINVNK